VPLLAHIHNFWNRRLQLRCGMHYPDAIAGVSERVIRNFRSDPVAAARIRVVCAGSSPTGATRGV
jgi:hypothetical protein